MADIERCSDELALDNSSNNYNLKRRTQWRIVCSWVVPVLRLNYNSLYLTVAIRSGDSLTISPFPPWIARS